ncbi:MAG: recombinase family protein [Pseudomonadota bacterium]
MSKTKEQAIIYCRVSDSKQKTEGHGLESQETRCLEYARQRGYKVAGVFKDDASGGIADRPAFGEMLAYLAKNRKRQHVVIVDDINRVARSLEVHLLFRKQIGELGARFESPTMTFGDGADDRMVEMMLVNVAEYQRNKNAEQTRNRMWGRIMNGYWVFQAPRGYKHEKVGAHGKLLVRNEPIASIMQEALERYADGRLQTLTEVKRFFDAQPDFFKDVKANEVHIQRIREWLTQVLYAGYIERPEWGIELREAQHEGLISLSTFQKIQDRLAGRSVNVAQAPVRKDLREEMPLRGFVRCGDCGNPLSGGRSKGRNKYYVYYECHNKECASYRKSIRKADIEGEFEELLASARPSRKLFNFVHALLKDLWDKHGERLTTQKRSLAKQLREIDAKIELLVDRTLDTSSPALIKRYEERVHDLEIEKAALVDTASLPAKPRDTFERTFRTAMEFLANPLTLWASGRFEDKRIVLKMTFANQLAYKRNEGFRTANFSLPFKLLRDFSEQKWKMVPLAGLEPALP